MNQAGHVVSGAAAVPQRHVQRVQRQIGLHRPSRSPAHDHPGEHVDRERDVDKPGEGRYVGEVDHPQLVRPGRGEVALDQVRRASSSLVRDRGPHPTSAPNPLHTSGFHQPFNRAAGNRRTLDGDALTPQLVVDLPGP